MKKTNSSQIYLQQPYGKPIVFRPTRFVLRITSSPPGPPHDVLQAIVLGRCEELRRIGACVPKRRGAAGQERADGTGAATEDGEVQGCIASSALGKGRVKGPKPWSMVRCERPPGDPASKDVFTGWCTLITLRTGRFPSEKRGSAHGHMGQPDRSPRR